MTLVETDQGWQIEGEGNERACIAYASEEDGHLVFSLEKSSSLKVLYCEQHHAIHSTNVRFESRSCISRDRRDPESEQPALRRHSRGFK